MSLLGGSGTEMLEDVGVEFEERRQDRPLTVRVVPVKHVIWVASALFVLWNIVGFPLLDYYLTRKFAEHNKDADAHAAAMMAAAERAGRNDKEINDALGDIAQRLARIEGALGLTEPVGNGRRK